MYEHKNENGYIVVETVGTFIPFVLLIISILSLVNIVTLQARIHYALTQTAGALSMYSYVLHATGIENDTMAMDSNAHEFSKNMGGVIDGINALMGSRTGDIDAGRISDSLQYAAGDPKAMIQGFANYGLSELRSGLTATFVTPMFHRYLLNGKTSVEQYHTHAGLVNFELADCSIVDKDGNVKITAEYEVDYTFGALKLPFTPTLKISQTVVTKAWLGGSGEGYQG